MSKLAIESLIPKGWRLIKDATFAERSWPEDSKQENGNYHCRCVDCDRTFAGHKRRHICKSCVTNPCVQGKGIAG